MKTDIKHLAAFAASAIWADGVYDDAEKVVLGEIADALEVNEEEFVAQVESTLSQLEPMTDEQLNEYLLESGAEVDEDEAAMVYLAAMQIVTCDGVLGVEEVENLLSIATALGLDDSYAMLLLLDLVKQEPEIELEF